MHGHAAAALYVQTFGLWGCRTVLHPTSSRYAPVRVLRARLEDILTKEMACPIARLANGLAVHKIQQHAVGIQPVTSQQEPLAAAPAAAATDSPASRVQQGRRRW